MIGAGVAGLAAALRLTDQGHTVTVYESGPQAGGRCRSYYDRELGCWLDNGNHLWLSGNTAIAGFVKRIGSEATVAGPHTAKFPFHDLRTGKRWTVRPNHGRIPWWVLSPSRRVPGAGLLDYAAMARLLTAGPDMTVTQAVPKNALYDKLIEPLVIAALNTAPSEGAACLMGAVMRETLALGGHACIPAYPLDGLSATFIDPALAALAQAGACVQFGRRITALSLGADRVLALQTADGPVPVGDDAVVLAVPAPVAQNLLPGLVAPDAFEAIINLHYRYAQPADDAGFVGILGGTAEWAFTKPGVISVTISAANRLVDRSTSDLAATVWQELASVFSIRQPIPAWRVVKEKRATFAATPAENRKRPDAVTAYANLTLAGDWTNTGLPATIEGAIRSGYNAAAALARPRDLG